MFEKGWCNETQVHTLAAEFVMGHNHASTLLRLEEMLASPCSSEPDLNWCAQRRHALG
jgi:hypothetical protein